MNQIRSLFQIVIRDNILRLFCICSFELRSIAIAKSKIKEDYLNNFFNFI